MRKLFHVLLSLVIVYASTMGAYASAVGTSPGGWSAVDAIIDGAVTTINATKQSGGKALRSAVAIAPNAGKVGKVLLRGGLVGALAMAVPQLIGEGVDWVLDPANNSIKLSTPISTGACSGYSKFGVPQGTTASGFCAIKGLGVLHSVSSTGSVICTSNINMSYALSCPVGTLVHSIPIDTVAAKVIANAEAGHAPSQEAVKAGALEGFAAGEHDAALDASAVPDSNVDTDNPPTDTPTDPTKPYDDSGIKDLLRKILAALAGISAISALLEFFKDEPVEKESKPVDVDVPNPTKAPNEFDVSYVKFGGQCPAMPSFSIDILGASSSMTFDMTPLCNLAVAIRPAIVAIAYFIGLGVIASAIRET